MGSEKLRGLRRVIATELEWLAGLRWISPLEYWLTLGAAIGILFTGYAAVAQTGEASALSISAAHFMLLVAIVAAAPRKLAWPLLATLCLSIVNYAALLLMNSPLLQLITLSYLWMGCLAGLAALAVAPRLTRRWEAIAAYNTRDDFRWLVSEAPLWLRWRFQDEIQAVQGRQPQPPQA